MQRASDANCNYAVIVGDSEVSGDFVTIKDLVEGIFQFASFELKLALGFQFQVPFASIPSVTARLTIERPAAWAHLGKKSQ